MFVTTSSTGSATDKTASAAVSKASSIFVFIDPQTHSPISAATTRTSAAVHTASPARVTSAAVIARPRSRSAHARRRPPLVPCPYPTVRAMHAARSASIPRTRTAAPSATPRASSA